MIFLKKYLSGYVMKLFVLLTFCLTFLSAQTKNLTNERCKNCQAVLPKKRIENELKNILFKVKAYKKEKNLQIETLRKKIHKSQQRKKAYIRTLNAKNNQIKELQHQLNFMRKQLTQKKKVIISLKQKLIHENPVIISAVSQKDTPQKWIKITVNNDLNIYDLALKYYGDSQEYEKIYMANQNKIDKNYQVKNGMSLKIPITENFMEQPMYINTY